MTTIVNNPAPSSDNNKSGIGLLIGVFVVIVIGLLFFYFGLPIIKRLGSGQTITPQIVVPDKINVNVNQN